MLDIDNLMEADFSRGIQAKVQSIQRDIQELRSTCGSCKLWMTRGCPREKNTKVTGGMRACDLFKIDSLSKKVIENLELEIQKLQNP